MAAESQQKLTALLKKALHEAGRILRKGYTEQPRVTYKTPLSPVTHVDLASEKKIVTLIRQKYPDHTFLAEESAYLKKGDLGPPRADRYRWVIDPLDGTVNFIHRIPQFCVSIAVEKNGRVLAGGILDPIKNELFLAVRGKGATVNSKTARVSLNRKMIQAVMITGFPYDRNKKTRRYLNQLEPFLRKSGGIRRFGSAALDMAWIAAGRADGFWELGLSPWDVAAGWILVEEAGGRVSNFNNQPYSLRNTRQTLATNGLVHRTMVKTLK